MPMEMPCLFGSLFDMPVQISAEIFRKGENPRNLLALVTLPQFKRGEAEEDVAKCTEVSDWFWEVDWIAEQTDAL